MLLIWSHYPPELPRSLIEAAERVGFSTQIVSSFTEMSEAVADPEAISLLLIEVRKETAVKIEEALTTRPRESRPPLLFALTGDPGQTALDRLMTIPNRGFLCTESPLSVLTVMLKQGAAVRAADHLPPDILLRRHSELRKLLDHLPVPLIISKESYENVVLFNRKFTEFFGYTAEEIPDVSAWWMKAYPDPAYREELKTLWLQELTAARKENREINPVHARVRTRSGKTVWVRCSAFTWNDYQLVTFHDQTELIQNQRKLQKSLDEKDFLMKEMNHRIKNNLALLTSLISLKQDEIGEAADLSDIEYQIDAISLIHDQLNQRDDITTVDLNAYLAELISNLFETMAENQPEIVLSIAPLHIAAKKAVTLGLIINELATNAIKHGLKNAPGNNRFSLELQELPAEETIRLTVCNTGHPFPEDVSLEDPRSLGLKLVTALTDQLRGTITLRKRPNPVFSLTFPLEDPAQETS